MQMHGSDPCAQPRALHRAGGNPARKSPVFMLFLYAIRAFTCGTAVLYNHVIDFPALFEDVVETEDEIAIIRLGVQNAEDDPNRGDDYRDGSQGD